MSPDSANGVKKNEYMPSSSQESEIHILKYNILHFTLVHEINNTLDVPFLLYVFCVSNMCVKNLRMSS